MRTLATIITIFGAIIQNSNGISIRPYPPIDRPTEPVVMCPMIYKFCPEGQYWGLAANGCNDCLECPMYKLGPCKDGSYPVKNPTVQNQCPTYSCPSEPVACTMEYKICPLGQYWGPADNGCNDCLDCPVYDLAPCSDGSFPIQDPLVENKCPTYSCPSDITICTMEYKICAVGQYWGIGANGCHDCLPCKRSSLKRCANGSLPTMDPPVENKCPTYSCKKCTGRRCFTTQPIDVFPQPFELE